MPGKPTVGNVNRNGVLRDLFTRSFTDGIRDPHNGRVRESEWRQAMVRLRDSIVYCQKCTEPTENFYDVHAMKASGGASPTCWSCGGEIRLPFRMRLNREIVMLNYDTKLYPHHIDGKRQWDFSEPAAIVTQNPQDPTVWGLKNATTERWVCTLPDGTTRDVDQGRSVTLSAGSSINFGSAQGEVRL